MSGLNRVKLRGDTIVRVGHNDIKCPLKGNSQSLHQSLSKVNVALVQLDNDQISVPTWLEGLENTKYRKTQNFLKNHEIFAKIIRSISGAV